MARFSLYWIYEDQSYGVHNPTYVKACWLMRKTE